MKNFNEKEPQINADERRFVLVSTLIQVQPRLLFDDLINAETCGIEGRDAL